MNDESFNVTVYSNRLHYFTILFTSQPTLTLKNPQCGLMVSEIGIIGRADGEDQAQMAVPLGTQLQPDRLL